MNDIFIIIIKNGYDFLYILNKFIVFFINKGSDCGQPTSKNGGQLWLDVAKISEKEKTEDGKAE